MQRQINALKRELQTLRLMVTATQNDFCQEGDVIELQSVDSFNGNFTCDWFFRGTSTRIGSDVWSVGWIVDGLLAGKLDVVDCEGNVNDRRKERIIGLHDAILNELDF